MLFSLPAPPLNVPQDSQDCFVVLDVFCRIIVIIVTCSSSMDLTLQDDHDLVVVIILYAQVSIVAPFLLFFSMKHGLVACGVLLSHFLPKKLVGQKKK
jgi:hypothetical protein